jgi:peptidoglycan/LPS O-acetylase OafA/YrhL
VIDLVGLWSHLLAACLYGALALWQLRRWRAEPRQRPLVTAFAAVSVCSIFMALLGPFHFLSQLADCARHLAFLAFMYGVIAAPRRSGRSGRSRRFTAWCPR